MASCLSEHIDPESLAGLPIWINSAWYQIVSISLWSSAPMLCNQTCLLEPLQAFFSGYVFVWVRLCICLSWPVSDCHYRFGKKWTVVEMLRGYGSLCQGAQGRLRRVFRLGRNGISRQEKSGGVFWQVSSTADWDSWMLRLIHLHPVTIPLLKVQFLHKRPASKYELK